MAGTVNEATELMRDWNGFAGFWLERLVLPEAALAYIGRVTRTRVRAQDLLGKKRWFWRINYFLH